jgi:hypothetical protein
MANAVQWVAAAEGESRTRSVARCAWAWQPKQGGGAMRPSAVHRHPPYPSGARDRNPSGHQMTPRRPAPQWNRPELWQVRKHLRIPEIVLCDLAARAIFVT